MQLLSIIAFALVFWRSELTHFEPWMGSGSLWRTLLIAAVPSVFVLVIGLFWRWRMRILVRKYPDFHEIGLSTYHRLAFIFRIVAGVGFGALVFLTPWPGWFEMRKEYPALQVIGDLATLSPFFVSVFCIWVMGYLFEWKVRGLENPNDVLGLGRQSVRSRIRSYLDFHIRHQFLIVGVPMTIILFVSNLTDGHGELLKRTFGAAWAPDAILGAVGVVVFVFSPVLLKHIWRTHPLESGELRERLERLCGRIGLRIRDILVWSSDGLMINAAVMGVFPSLRYVLLSDALLQTMSTEQIEAVFGHEAGHVKHRHIQFFLVFAFVGWLIVAGLMEWVGVTLNDNSWTQQASSLTAGGVGILATVVVWCAGFGWLSRRFERQADMFGARCANPDASHCHLPCGLHVESELSGDDSANVCATGAAVFSSALRRVAALNGIPLEEASWRHGSIGHRIRALRSLAGDPQQAMRFTRLLRRVRVVLICVAVVGALASGVYMLLVYGPRSSGVGLASYCSPSINAQGAIEVASKLGVGTTFTPNLPSE